MSLDGPSVVGGICAIVALLLIWRIYRTDPATRRKPNIRVPKETLWARTHKHHGTKP